MSVILQSGSLHKPLPDVVPPWLIILLHTDPNLDSGHILPDLESEAVDGLGVLSLVANIR